jgi:hypothetical protein
MNDIINVLTYVLGQIGDGINIAFASCDFQPFIRNIIGILYNCYYVVEPWPWLHNTIIYIGKVTLFRQDPIVIYLMVLGINIYHMKIIKEDDTFQMFTVKNEKDTIKCIQYVKKDLFYLFVVPFQNI